MKNLKEGDVITLCSNCKFVNENEDLFTGYFIEYIEDVNNLKFKIVEFSSEEDFDLYVESVGGDLSKKVYQHIVYEMINYVEKPITKDQAKTLLNLLK